MISEFLHNGRLQAFKKEIIKSSVGHRRFDLWCTMESPRSGNGLYFRKQALALAEIAVHLCIANVPADFLMITIDIPDRITVFKPEPDTLPFGWDEFPYNACTRLLGRDFLLLKDACIMKVPSAVVKGDFNYLINPSHSDFKKIRIIETRDFIVGGRLLK